MSPQSVPLVAHYPTPVNPCNADYAVADALETVTGDCKVHVQPFPLVFHTCQPGSCVRRQIRLANAGEGSETISVSASNPRLIVLHKEKLTLAPGASVLVPVIIRVPHDFSRTRKAGRCSTPEAALLQEDADFAIRELIEIRGLGWQLDLPVMLKRKAGSNSNEVEKGAGRMREDEEPALAGCLPLAVSSTSEASQSKREISDEQCVIEQASRRRSQTSAVSVEGAGSAGKSPLVTDERRSHSRPNLSMKCFNLAPRPRGVNQHRQCIGRSFLGRQNCEYKPSASRSRPATPDLPTAPSAGELAHCNSRSSSCSIANFLAESLFAGSSAARRRSADPPRDHFSPFMCARQNSERRPGASCGSQNKSRPRGPLRRSSTSLLPPEKLSDSSTTAAAAPHTERDWQVEEAIPFDTLAKSFTSESARRQEAAFAETAEKRAESLAATNHLLREALQRSKAEIAALELLQSLQEKTQLPQDSVRLPESAASPSLSTQSQDPCEPVDELHQGASLLKEARGARVSELVRAEQKQSTRKGVRRAEQQGDQKADKKTREPEIGVLAQLQTEFIYPFQHLRAITGDLRTVAREDTSPTSKCIQEELHRSQAALQQQQQEVQKVKGELRRLKATLAATSLQSEKQKSLLEGEMKKAKAAARTAAAEAAVAKAREEQLQLQLAKLQQQLAALERCAAATSSRFSAQLQAAEAREKQLKQSLAEAQESLAFIESLPRKPLWVKMGPSFGSTGRRSEDNLTLDRRGPRSLSSCSFRSSNSAGETGSLQHQEKNCERKTFRRIPMNSDQSAACHKSLQAPLPPSILDSGGTGDVPPPCAAADGPCVAHVTRAGAANQGERAITTLVSPENPPEDLLSVASSFYREQTPGARSSVHDASVDCCRSAFCGQVRWILQQRLCRASARLIVKTQLLAAEQAKAQELQLLVDDHAAAARAAEASADRAFKKLLSVMSRNASLQAKLALGAAAASATQPELGDAAKTNALLKILQESQKRLYVQCSLLTKEKDVWKERLGQQLRKQYQLMEELHQQQLLLVDAHEDCGWKTHRPHQEQEKLARDSTRQSGRCSRAAEEGTTSLQTDALSAAAECPPASKADPLLGALQQLVKGLQQLEKDVTFLRPSCGAADKPLRSLSTSSGSSAQHEPSSQQCNEHQSALVVCQWPQDRGCQTESLCESRYVKNGTSIERPARGLAQGLTKAGNDLMKQLCLTLLELGSRLRDCRDEAKKNKREASMLRNVLRSERVTRCRVHVENGILEAQLSALQTKDPTIFRLKVEDLNVQQMCFSLASLQLTVMESIAEVEAQQAAENHKAQVAEISRQLQCALETLKGWERERPLLVSQQLALAQKASRLEAALRAALVRARQETLSGWRESLVKTTVEAAESCCDCNFNSSGSKCDIKTGTEGTWRCWKQQNNHNHVPNWLKRRHAAAELAILELTDALTNAYFLLACSARGTTGHARGFDQTAHEDEEADAKEEHSPTQNAGSFLSGWLHASGHSTGSSFDGHVLLYTSSFIWPSHSNALAEAPQLLVQDFRRPWSRKVPLSPILTLILPESPNGERAFWAFSLDERDASTVRVNAAARFLGAAEVAEELANLSCSPSERSAKSPWPQLAAEKCERPQQGSGVIQRATRPRCCPYCQENSRRVLEQHWHQQQLFAAYSAQQQELQSTSGALSKALAETARLRDCLKVLEMQIHALREAAAMGEAASTQSATLQAQLNHVEDSLERERRVRGREMHLLSETHRVTLQQSIGAHQREAEKVLKAAQNEADAAKQQLHLYQCCARLASLEREKLLTLTPAGLVKQLPFVNLRKHPVHPPDVEEALLAHRLLLSSLIKAQLPCKPQRDETAGQGPPQKLQRLAWLSVADAQASGSDSSSTSEMEEKGQVSECCSSLAALILSHLKELGCCVFLPTKSHCSKCTGQSLAALAVAGARGHPSQQAFQAAEGQATRMVQHIQSLEGILSFVVAAQQRLFDLFDARAGAACTFPDASKRASESPAAAESLAENQPEVQPRAEEEAAEAWVLQRHLRSAASETAEALKAAHRLSISLRSGIASLVGAEAGNTRNSASSIVCNSNENSAPASAVAPHARMLRRKDGVTDQQPSSSTSAIDRRSQLKGPPRALSRGAVAASGAATPNQVAAPATGLSTGHQSIKTEAVLCRSSKHPMHAASEKSAPLADNQPTRKHLPAFCRRIRRCKSCDFEDPRRALKKTTLIQRSHGRQAKKGGEGVSVCWDRSQDLHLPCPYLRRRQQADTSSGIQKGQRHTRQYAGPAGPASCCSCNAHARPYEVDNSGTDMGDPQQAVSGACPPQQFLDCLNLCGPPTSPLPPFAAHRMRGDDLEVCTGGDALRESDCRLQTHHQTTDGHVASLQWEQHHCTPLPSSRTSQSPQKQLQAIQHQLHQHVHQQERWPPGVSKEPGACTGCAYQRTDARTDLDSLGHPQSGHLASYRPAVRRVLLRTTCLPTGACRHQRQLSVRASGQFLNIAESAFCRGPEFFVCAEGRQMSSTSCTRKRAPAIPRGRLQSHSNDRDQCSFGLYARQRAASSLMHFLSQDERPEGTSESSYDYSLRRLRQNTALAAELNQRIS
ncbi:hypothetical protein ACSSS7_002530 [Eimeria intestinalis]